MNSNIYKKITDFLEQEKMYGNTFYKANVPAEAILENIQLIDNPEISKNTEISPEIMDNKIKIDVSSELFSEKPEWMLTDNLQILNEKICNCIKCSLGLTRKNFVFGTGNPDADIMFIGEAPGADEDEQGFPFVGRAGQLLTNIIESINLTREEVFICNIIKCRPPENRRPAPSEINECLPYLHKQIELIKPVFIVALGATAVESLLNLKGKMGDLRGKLHEFHGIKTLITFHPAALLRNPAWKRDVWEDVKLLRKLYNEYLQIDLK